MRQKLSFLTALYFLADWLESLGSIVDRLDSGLGSLVDRLDSGLGSLGKGITDLYIVSSGIPKVEEKTFSGKF